MSPRQAPSQKINTDSAHLNVGARKEHRGRVGSAAAAGSPIFDGHIRSSRAVRLLGSYSYSYVGVGLGVGAGKHC